MFHDVTLNEKMTEETFGYCVDDLGPGSCRKVVVECQGCHRIIHREYRNRNGKHQCPVVEGSQKRCFKCEEWKDLSLFNKAPKLSGGVSKMCRECWNSYGPVIKAETNRKYRIRESFKNGDIEYYTRFRCNCIRSQAKKKGIPFDVDPKFLLDLWRSQEGLCYYTGIPMTCSMQQEGFQAWDAPSLDRKSPHLGYVKDNVAWCIFGVNSFKQSLDENQFNEAIERITWWFKYKD